MHTQGKRCNISVFANRMSRYIYKTKRIKKDLLSTEETTKKKEQHVALTSRKQYLPSH